MQQDRPRAPDRSKRRDGEMMEALAYSLLSWVEETSGLRREDVLGQSEFPREDDPHDALDQALGERRAAA